MTDFRFNRSIIFTRKGGYFTQLIMKEGVPHVNIYEYPTCTT